ncbi:MAG: sensor histidine kinase [Candidatus Nitrosothermus koennekii]|nr:MAG: sensor histidine kinase [Candidatus Nitrosothermus koennekii]
MDRSYSKELYTNFSIISILKLKKGFTISINSKIIALSLLLSLGTLIIITSLSFSTANELLRKRAEDQLLSEATGRGAAIRSLITLRIEQIRFLGEDEVIKDILKDLHNNQMDNPRSLFLAEVEPFINILGASLEIDNIKLLDNNANILLSTDPVEEGKRFTIDKVEKAFLTFAPVNGERKAIVAVPVLDDGRSIGSVIATLGVSDFDKILLNRKGLGNTGEVYMVNEDKMLISESRFIENAAFRTVVDTLPVRECFDNGIEISGRIYPDYRGVPIFGSSYCARDLGFVLLAEIDEAELFAPITELRDATLMTALIISAVVTMIALFISMSITKPLKELEYAASRISEGDFTYEVNVKSNDEIGQLARQFDRMRRSILETNMNLNRLVKERTKELTDITTALDTTAIVSITDKEGRIMKVNKKFVEISKYSEEELLGKTHSVLKSGYHDPKFFEDMWKTISSGKIWEGEIKNRAKDGTYYWVKATIVPFLDENGKPKQYISIQHDITELKRIEEQLQEALERNKASAKIIKEQLEELEKVNIELRRKDKLKDEFLSMASHELKTPLTPIIGWCSALKSNMLGKLSDEQRAAIDTIESNAAKLEKLISDMLDVQKLELDEMKFNIGEVDIDQLLENIKRDFELMMKEKGITFIVTADKGLKLKSDGSRISQVLSALLYNAVDFVPANTGRIEVIVKDKGENIEFCVKDNGPGIPKDKQRFLFRKFYQIDTSLTRKHGGTGLGLAISKGIVTKLGGDIWVETEEGKGSSFYFSLPKGYKYEDISNR